MTWYSPMLPMLIGVLLLAASAFLARARLGIVGLVFILPAYGLMTPLGANLLVLAIEHRIKPAEASAVCGQVQAVVFLSGGLDRPAAEISDFGALTPETMARLFAWQAQGLNERRNSLSLIVAGGGPFRIPEAEVIAALLHRIEPDRLSMELETGSASTRESAVGVRKLLPSSVSRIALASSALHLPRAILAFEQVGFEVCPWALNRHYMAVTGWTILLPHSSSLAKSEMALHEIIGEAQYRLSGH